MGIIIGADLVPTASNQELFSEGAISELLGEELEKILKNSQYTIFNLETPICDSSAPIKKRGVHLCANVEAVKGIKAMGVHVLSLANNHIMDQGSEGLRKTVSLLNKYEIGHLGAGDNLHEARKPIYMPFSGKIVGVLAFAEHEFSIAEDNTPGASPFDPLDSLDYIREISKQCDYLIVLYHGGKEHYRYPSPYLQKICRKIVDCGADLVICQHSHCIGCSECYHSKTIVYGQGNFLFDHEDNEFWATSLLIRLNERFEIDYIPLSKQANKVRMAENGKEILEGFCERSEQIKDESYVENEYKRFAENQLAFYLRNFRGGKVSFVDKVLRRIVGKEYYTKKYKRIYGEDAILGLINCVECEAHRDLCVTALKNSIAIDERN